VDLDGENLRQITYSDVFDGFPMFSPDGTKLAFASNRYGTVEGDTNIFIADWVEN
jgi:Tol biopolymer transport system component